MINFYAIARESYLAGNYTAAQLEVFVDKGKITFEQREAILAEKIASEAN